MKFTYVVTIDVGLDFDPKNSDVIDDIYDKGLDVIEKYSGHILDDTTFHLSGMSKINELNDIEVTARRMQFVGRP